MIESLALMRRGAPVKGAIAFAFEQELPAARLHLASMFTETEIEFMNSLRFPKRQNSFLLGRIAAKRALGLLLEESDSRRFEIRKGVFEQPVLRGAAAELSIAHTDRIGVAVCAEAGHPVGVDLEMIGSREIDALRPAFTHEEIERLTAFGLSDNGGWYAGWTAKEALAKILRCGLMTPFPVLEIASVAGHAERFESRFISFAQYKAVTWILAPLILTIVLPERTEMSWNPETRNTLAGQGSR